MKTQEIYGMEAVVTSRGAADTAITLAKTNPKATWEAILRLSESKSVSERPRGPRSIRIRRRP
jgi:hypothetical protein